MKATVVLIVLLQSLMSRAVAEPSWKLAVRQFDVPLTTRPQPALFWVGLTNASPEPRAFCLYGVYYGYETPEGEVVSGPSESHPTMGAVHRCSGVPEAGNLVLPGQTQFVKVRLPRLPESVLRRGIEFSVFAEEACVTSERCEFQGRDIRGTARWSLGAAER